MLLRLSSIFFVRLAALITLLLTAHTARAEVTWQNLNRAAIDGHIVPRYQVLADTTRAFDAQVQTLCTHPTPINLALARGRFAAALDAWNGISQIRFGPVESDQRYYRFQLWPDRRGTGQRQVAQAISAADDGMLAPEAFAAQSVAVQGFGALEILLFPTDQVSLDDLAPGGTAGFRCRFAAAVTANLAAMAQSVLSDWTAGDSPYRDQLLATGPQHPRFPNDKVVSSELLKAIGTTMQLIEEQKLSGPLWTSAETARPKRAEAWRSARSVRNICSNLRAAEHLYATTFTPMLRLSPEGMDSDRQIALLFSAAENTCLRLDERLAEAVADPEKRPDVVHLRDLTRGLRSHTGKQLAEALGLRLGFNSLDGD